MFSFLNTMFGFKRTFLLPEFPFKVLEIKFIFLFKLKRNTLLFSSYHKVSYQTFNVYFRDYLFCVVLYLFSVKVEGGYLTVLCDHY